MKNIIIKNESLTVEISTCGAEVQSVKCDSRECLWSGDPEVWEGHAPVLFPICGRLTEENYTYNGEVYELCGHGFAKTAEFEVEKADENEAVFLLRDNDDTRSQYPFGFEFRVIYEVSGNELSVKYSVKNTDNKEMYFSVGAHEAYACPGGIEGYSLKFEKEEEFETLLLDGSFLNRKSLEISKASDKLPLRYEFFKLDTLIFDKLNSKKVSLIKNSGETVAEVDFSQFDNLLIWTIQNAEFVCIEPWNGLPDYTDTDGDLKNKAGIIPLKPNDEYDCEHKIRFI